MKNIRHIKIKKCFGQFLMILTIILNSFNWTFGTDWNGINLGSNKDNIKNELNNNIKKYFSLQNFASSEDAINPYPVGSVYITIDATNPNGILEGTWTQINGKTLVGYNSSDSAFNVLKKVAGNKSIQMNSTTMPQHTHTWTSIDVTTEAFNTKHTHIAKANTNASMRLNHEEGATKYTQNYNYDGNKSTTLTWNGSHKHSYSSWNGTIGKTGSTNPIPISLLSPYIVVYMWYRTA